MTQCFQILNAAYFTNIQTQMGSSSTGEELQALTNQAMNELSMLQSTLTSQLGFIQPIEALLTAPSANLTDIVNWIQSLITDVLTPLYKPYANIVAQLAAITAMVTTLTATIEAAESRLGVSITIPPVSTICTL